MRLPFRAALVAAALAAGACGGGGGEADPAPAAPAAAVDPDSANVVTDPINRAKNVGAAQEEHDREVDDLIGGTQP